MPEVKILLADQQEKDLKGYLYSIAVEAIQKARNDAGLDRDLVNKREMASWLGISPVTLDELISKGLPVAVLGERTYFLSKQEVRKFLLSYNKN